MSLLDRCEMKVGLLTVMATVYLASILLYVLAFILLINAFGLTELR